jgi:histidine ammonia-lyase
LNKIKIEEIYESLQRKQVPSSWTENKGRIEKDFEHLQCMLQKDHPPKIYGVNTLVGHLDTEILSTNNEIREFQKQLIENHLIGTEPYFSRFTASCIGFVKINQISNGGTCISPDLYQLLLQVIFEENFQPKIPMHASYSSGDVIPGAHWAYELLTFISKKENYSFKPKEGISLINGSYVHVGYVLSLFKELNNCWKQFVYNSFLNSMLVKAYKTNYLEYLNHGSSTPVYKSLQRLVSLLGDDNEYKRQDPVSIRSLPQIFMVVSNSIKSLKDTLEEEINRRSDNPLIVHEFEIPLSQSSFLSPMLTIETSKLIETLLMTMWHIERRIHYLLSGTIKNIPLNGSTKENPLGFIQIPKLITSILEEARLEGGRRVFASGGSTSYGIEDFWTFGVHTTHVLKNLLNKFAYMLSLELIVSAHLYENFHVEPHKEFEVPCISSKNISSLSREYRQKILKGRNTFINKFIEVDFLK